MLVSKISLSICLLLIVSGIQTGHIDGKEFKRILEHLWFKSRTGF